MSLPIAVVALQKPQTLPVDYTTMAGKGEHAKLVFRIWDDTSASPLVWDPRNTDASGFSCPNGNLARLTPPIYLKHHKDKRGNVNWVTGQHVFQSVCDHVIGKWRSTALNVVGAPDYEEGADIPEDEKSAWISTSRSLQWAIWEGARRLAKAHVPVVDLDPDRPNGLDYVDEVVPAKLDLVVNLTIINHHSGTIGLQDPARHLLEAHIDPKSALCKEKWERLTLSRQNTHEEARESAIRSSEVLYYGRIFRESILYNLEFSIEEPPLELPEYLYRPGHRRAGSPASDTSESLPGWLESLVWDPLRDAYDVAVGKINRRASQLGIHLSKRPPFDYLSRQPRRVPEPIASRRDSGWGKKGRAGRPRADAYGPW